MKHLIHIAILAGLLSVAHRLPAQSQTRIIQGIIKDQQTLEAVPSVHVVTAQRGTFSDDKGFFSIRATTTDTVIFSHVNYQSHYLAASAVRDTLILFLPPRDHILREVVVRGLPTEEQFKNQLLRAQLQPSREEVHARTNIAYARELYLSGYVPTMNSRDNYQWQLQEPQGITLFSSGPTQGLSKAVKNLLRNKNTFLPPQTHPGPTVSDILLSKPTRDTLHSHEYQDTTSYLHLDNW